MNIGLFMGHPAHFHMLKHTAENLKHDGHRVFVVIKKKDILETLCQDAGLEYYKIREGRGGSKWGLIKSVIGMEYHMWQFIHRNKIELLMGSTLSFTAAKINCIPVIAMGEDDADVVPNYAKLVYPFASVVLTPDSCNNGKWEAKSSKYPSYHELAYLHPNHFTPDPEIVRSYGIPVASFHHSINSSFSSNSTAQLVPQNTNSSSHYAEKEQAKPYFILRFASLNAHHDDGIKGINTDIAQRLIDILSPHGRIYITSERPLEPQFEQYRIRINPLDMHHVMAFASLYIGDSQTMAAEAGVLGVPFVRFNDFVGRIGYLRELEDVYELGYGIHASVLTEDSPIRKSEGSIQPSGTDALYKAVEQLVAMDATERRALYQQRRQKMLSDKIDCAKFLTWFIENYPESAVGVRKADDTFWKRFK